MESIVECVPNISEGRDIEKIERITNSIAKIPGCAVLGIEPDADYNRTVITIAGRPESVEKAAFILISKAIDEIDMRVHHGEHPRLGSVDVCPFVPLRGVTMEQCSAMAMRLAEKVAEECRVPTYVYGEAALHDDKKLLSTIRKGQYEGLQARMSDGQTEHLDSTRYPDFGPKEWNERISKSGAITIGSRGILVAYNVNIDEKDASVSKKIGSLVRSSGRLIKNIDGRKMRVPGMLTLVQGMGVTLESHGISQVSMNLRDVEKCPMHVAYEACKTLANDHGIQAPGSELVGLVPLQAMLESGRWYAPEGVSDDAELVKAAIEGLGLSQLDEFIADERIIEWAVSKAVAQ
jgi:glutamate formiminotransferase/formiminotetrahydrofolate cyclodeaminase